MIKAVSFDCFGVLLEDSWLAFMKQYEGTPEAFDELRYINQQVDRGQATYDEFLQKVSDIGHISKARALDIIQKGHSLNQELFSFIKQLQSRYQLGLLSNVGQPIEKYIPKEWADVFSVKTLSYEVGAIKPDPYIYEVHITTLGLAPEEIVFIDDRQPNCEAARACGMQAIWYESVPQLKKDLRKLGVGES